MNEDAVEDPIRKMRDTVFAVKKLPATLFHYTSAEAAQAIIMSKKLWATDCLYFNDAMELRAGIATFRAAVKVLSEKFDKPQQRYIRGLGDVVDAIEGGDIYAACLSTRPDQLSQWRSYCPRVGGYAIGMRGPQLDEAAQAQGFLLVPCVYSRSKQVRLVAKAIQVLVNMGEEFALPDLKKSVMPTLVVMFLASFKNRAFQEEREWRLVSYIHPAHELAYTVLSMRASDGMFIPHREFSLAADVFGRVTLGPTRTAELPALGLYRLLRLAGLGHVGIAPSRIPYRNL